MTEEHDEDGGEDGVEAEGVEIMYALSRSPDPNDKDLTHTFTESFTEQMTSEGLGIALADMIRFAESAGEFNRGTVLRVLVSELENCTGGSGQFVN
jgi:hypothetical protein